MIGTTCGICALILSLSTSEPATAFSPIILKVADPVIIDTVNVFDIFKSQQVVQESEEVEKSAPTGLLVLSDEELEMAARIVHAEAGNQSKEGRRLVADVLLNRRDSSRFPNDIVSIVKQSGQFSTYRTGAYLKYEPTWDDYDTVILELDQRIDSSVLYFNCNNYISGTTPLYKNGDHYFSK